MQGESFFGDTLRVAGQVERLDEFVAGKLMLAAEAIRVSALLNFGVYETADDNARAGWHFELMNLGAESGGVPLFLAAELHGRFREREALHAAHGVVGGEKQIQLALERNFERVL